MTPEQVNFHQIKQRKQFTRVQRQTFTDVIKIEASHWPAVTVSSEMNQSHYRPTHRDVTFGCQLIGVDM